MKSQQISGLLLEETLFQVDLRADQLKQYLEKVQQAINGHTSSLNNLQVQINGAVKLQDYEQYLIRTANSISLRDAEFQQQVNFQLEKPLAENSADQIENAMCNLINKEHCQSQAMAFLFQRSKEWEQRVQKIEKDLQKNVSKEDLDNGLSQLRTKLADNIADGNKKLQKKISDLERQLAQNESKNQQNMNELQQKTLWKISDCEKLLQQRINDKFVETSCQAVYDRIMRDIAKQRDEGIKSIQLDMQDLKAKVQYNDENIQDKVKTIRVQLKELQDQLNLKYCTIEKHEQTKQLLGDRTLELQNKMAELMRKMDTVIQLEKLIPNIKILEERVGDCQHRGELNRKDIEDLKIRLENFDGSGSGTKSDVDPHKICQLDTDVKRLKGDASELEQKVRLIETELKRKIDVNEQRFLQQLNLLKQAPQQQSLSKEEVISIIEKDLTQPMSLLKSRILQIVGVACGEGQSFEIFIRNLVADIADLKKKFDLVADLDRRMKKQFKQMTSNETIDFMKYLQEKANEEDTKARFSAVDEKYKTLLENYNLLLKTCHELEEFIKYLQTLLYVNQQETVSILTGNHRVVTQKCLVCGGKNKLTKQVDKSGDIGQAKLYRGDFRPKDSAYENQEVFEMNPNQVTLVTDNNKYMGTSVGYKYPMTGSNQKLNDANSSSSGRVLRPQSSQPRKQQ